MTFVLHAEAGAWKISSWTWSGVKATPSEVASWCDGVSSVLCLGQYLANLLSACHLQNGEPFRILGIYIGASSQ